MSTKLTTNDVWARGINNPRPPDAKFSIGFECSDADPNMFNYLFWLYGNAIITLQNSLQALAGTDISALRQALVRTDDKVAEHTSTLDLLVPEVRTNTRLHEQVPSTTQRGRIAFANSTSIAAKGEDAASNSTTLPTKTIFRSIAQAFDDRRADAAEAILTQENKKFLTPALLNAWSKANGTFEATLSQSNRDKWKIYTFTSQGGPSQIKTIDVGLAKNAKGMWSALLLTGSGTASAKQYELPFFINWFGAFDADEPDFVVGEVGIPNSTAVFHWVLTITLEQGDPVAELKFTTSGSGDYLISRCAHYESLLN